ncbi:DUF6879 family protein [Streptomyces sp. NPDC001941]|uniref:DUF6879 family protein n=1 Tax=Streptomyces sp. NPDC001941 TaxID=3154659 RepID=UPI00332C0FD2
MTTSRRSLGDWLKDFEREAFRLETLDDYSQSGGVEAYRAFLAGEPQPEEYGTAGWLTTVGNATRSGKRMYRVHVVSRPLTDHLRFEFGWGYVRNMTAGEEFFVLDVTDQENPIPEAPDFWLFDDTTVGAMRYDDAGKFLGADFVDTGTRPEFLEYRDAAMSAAVPFSTWWARHSA